MASQIVSGTTTGGAVSQIVFTTWRSSIEVVNRGTVDMWARFDGVNPTVAGDECFYIPPRSFINVGNPKLPPDVEGRSTNCDIRLLTATACAYTVSAGL